jgi:hypothetical protein
MPRVLHSAASSLPFYFWARSAHLTDDVYGLLLLLVLQMTQPQAGSDEEDAQAEPELHTSDETPHKNRGLHRGKQVGVNRSGVHKKGGL